MAIYGGVREGWSYPSGPRFNETLFRGSATFSAAASVTVTLPLPCRAVTHVPSVELKSTAAPTDNPVFTVGNYTGNAFTIYAWSSSADQNAPPIAAAVTVGTSPWTYTSGTSGPPATNGELVVLDGTSSDACTVVLTRGSISSGARVVTSLLGQEFVLWPGDLIVVTWATAAPTMHSFPFPTLAGTPVAFSNSLTVEWEAWGNCSGGQGY